MAHKDTTAYAVLQPGSFESPLTSPASMDIIFIEGFTGETVIGIYESELHRPQPLVIDVHAGLARSRACDTDRIHDTIDYAEVCARLRRLMAEHRLQMLESFAEAIADILIGEFGADWVRVKVVKPNKMSDVRAVGVQIERTSDRAKTVDSTTDSADDRPSRGAAVLRLLGAGSVPGGR
jgi:dihydroneopterin aldolase